MLSESEGLSDWQEGLDNDKRSSRNWLFSNNNTSSLGKGLINSSHGVIRGLNFTQEDWLLESWLSSQLSGIENSSGSGDQLTTSSVDSISVQCHVMDVESDTSHVFFSHNSFLSSPLESRFARIFDFIQELNGLGYVDQKIRS